MALDNVGFGNVGNRTYADEHGHPILPWYDGIYPTCLEEVDAVRRAYNVTYATARGFDPSWAVEMYEKWTPKPPDTWWLITFTVPAAVDQDGNVQSEAVAGGILVECDVGPLALRRAMALGVRQVGRSHVSEPIRGVDIDPSFPRDLFLPPEDLYRYGDPVSN